MLGHHGDLHGCCAISVMRPLERAVDELVPIAIAKFARHEATRGTWRRVHF
jgi:hypothetical protein